jgi:hypothetical protein
MTGLGIGAFRRSSGEILMIGGGGEGGDGNDGSMDKK